MAGMEQVSIFQAETAGFEVLEPRLAPPDHRRPLR